MVGYVSLLVVVRLVKERVLVLFCFWCEVDGGRLDGWK